MGKLTDEDFEQMLGSARAGALEVLRKLEARGVTEGAVAVHLSPREVEREAGRLAGAAPEAPEGEEEAQAHGGAAPLDERLEEEILAYRKVKPSRAAPAPKPASKPRATAAQGAAVVSFCPSCGARAGEGHNFCAVCGFKLR